MKTRKKKIGTQVDPALHLKLKRIAAVTGRRIGAIVEDALRQALAGFPTDGITTFEEMHARYEKLCGMEVEITKL